MMRPGYFQQRLLSWFAKNGRHDLPWRKTWSGYHVLVSELMLQQTTVSAVIPYFHRFLKKFPSLKSLANARVDQVLALWSGLGYYARARNLHKAAQKIQTDFHGQMPNTRQEVESLPGVGPYTAGAILSFAFNKSEALVDGNVIRVFARIFGIRENMKDPKNTKRIWDIAQKMIHPTKARVYHSALMDFGATMCRPDSPDCVHCPFLKNCRAYAGNMQDEIPVLLSDRPKRPLHLSVGIVRCGDKYALIKRPDKGLYAGLWEFPSIELGKNKVFPVIGHESVTALFMRFFKMSPTPPISFVRTLPIVRHTLTHREITAHPWLGLCHQPIKSLTWRKISDINKMAISSLTRKIQSAVFI